MHPRNRLLLASLLVLLGAGAWIGQRMLNRQAVVAQHLPAVPELSSWPAALADEIGATGQLARQWRRAPQGLAALAALYHANGFYEEALVCYEGLRLIEPGEARWPHLAAAIATNFGRMDEALPLLRRTIELDPDYIPARLRLGDVLLKTNRTDEAAQAYAEALRRAPANPYALLGLARCDLAAGNWTKARELLRETLTLSPDFIGALSLLATVHEHLGDQAAADTIRAGIGRRQFSDAPDPWLDGLANVCFDPYRLSVAAAITGSAGDRARGLELIDRAIALAPKSSSYRRVAAQIMLADGNREGARRQLQQAVEINPADSDAWLLLIDALRQLRQEAAAQIALHLALAHCPQSAGLQLAMGQQLAATGRIPEAIARFRLSADLSPNDAAPLVEMADLCFASGQAETGLAALHQALARQPGNPLALTSLAFYHIVTGDEAGARRQWQEILRQPRTPPAMLEKLRQSYQRQFGRTLP